jgi:hypothetical protein
MLTSGALAACSSGGSAGASQSASGSASAIARPSSTATGEPVKGADLTALLANRTFSGEYDGAPYSEYYDADGTLRGRYLAGATTGTWKVEGETVCFTYTSRATPATDCYTANRVGDTVLWYENGKYSDSATFVMGNPNKY